MRSINEVKAMLEQARKFAAHEASAAVTLVNMCWMLGDDFTEAYQDELGLTEAERYWIETGLTQIKDGGGETDELGERIRRKTSCCARGGPMTKDHLDEHQHGRPQQAGQVAGPDSAQHWRGERGASAGDRHCVR